MPHTELARRVEIDKPVDHCAVVGVVSFSGRDVASDVRNGLHATQNRGEDGAGIAVLDKPSGIYKTHKDAGLVAHVFPSGRLKELGLSGFLAVGQTRYATSGSKEHELEDKASCLQPYVVGDETGSIALAHNGNIPREHLLRLIQELPSHVKLQSDTDSEVIAWRLFYASGKNFREKVANGLSGVVGAYSLVIGTSEGDLFGIKDPRGIRPLVFARTSDGVVLTSETSGLRYMSRVTDVQEIANGEMLHVDKYGNIRIDRIFPKINTAKCVVEPIYFKNPFSMEGNYEVREVRERMGRMLAQQFQVPADGVIVGVPESGFEIAEGYAKALERNSIHFIKKDRYKPEEDFPERTFIGDSDEDRDLALELKFLISPSVVGNKLYIIDDSIIRGNTTKKLIRSLREAGALEVHVLSGSPPFVNVCDLGVDIASLEDLAAVKMDGDGPELKSMEEIAEYLGADSVRYLSLEGLVTAIGGKKHDFCTGCLDGANPIEQIGDYHEQLYEAHLPEWSKIAAS